MSARRTVTAFYLHSLLGAPMMALYSLLSIILYRQMDATGAQITVLIMLKPMVSLISFHWSHWSESRTHDLRRQLLLSEGLCRLPFLLMPFVENCWITVALAGLYVTFHRGSTPAWMELLKRDLRPRLRERVVARGSTLFYLGMLAAAAVLGIALDQRPNDWPWISAGLASLGMLLVPSIQSLTGRLELKVKRTEGMGSLTAPWWESIALMSSERRFSHFQWGFFIAGGGLILMQPALPIYFTDHLGLSYKAVAGAVAICKGVGFALTSQLWARLISRAPFLQLAGSVAAVGALFSVYLLLAQTWLVAIYFAYLLYGVMQAGSELSWNLSGPIFAGDRDSRAHTRVSILMQGIRGALIPPIGSLITNVIDPRAGLYMGGVLCALGAVYLIRAGRRARHIATVFAR